MPEKPSPAEARRTSSMGARSRMGQVALLEANQPRATAPSGERAEQRRVQVHTDYLSRVAALRGRASDPEKRTWFYLMSGEINEVSGGGVQVGPRAALRLSGAEADNTISSFHTYVKTGVDYVKLRKEHPTERYKFYHSFGDKAAGEQYVADVIQQAQTKGISMSMKSFDHAYDGINFYTHHFKEMADIVQQTYRQHPDAWGATEHFLQGALSSVSPEHIGWVQEPVAGLSHSSHSGRMGRVGLALDRGGLTEAAYREGCASAGVLPDMPWLLTPDYDAQLRAEAATKFSVG